MEELPVMSVAAYTEMPVPPTKTNRGRNHSVLQARKRSHQICCAAEFFIFSTTHKPGVNIELSHRGELPDRRDHLGQRKCPACRAQDP